MNQLSPSAETAMNRLFYECSRKRRQLDDHLNRKHDKALRAVTWFMGASTVEFFNSRLVSRDLTPF